MVDRIREWRRNGWTWFTLSLAASLLSIATFVLGDRDRVSVVVQWSFISVQILCFVRAIICFRRTKREVR